MEHLQFPPLGNSVVFFRADSRDWMKLHMTKSHKHVSDRVDQTDLMVVGSPCVKPSGGGKSPFWQRTGGG